MPNYSFEVYRLQDVIKFIQLINDNDGRLFCVYKETRGGILEFFVIQYACNEELGMEVLT